MPLTVTDLVERALVAHSALAAIAEAVEDEWQYVTDLGIVWTGHLRAVAERRGTDPAAPTAVAAIDALSAEAARIVDPHRAIDWLSTLPQVALAALDEAA